MSYFINLKIRFKYRFGLQPMTFVSNWSLTFESYVKMIIAIKWWMKNIDMTNSFIKIIINGDMTILHHPIKSHHIRLLQIKH